MKRAGRPDIVRLAERAWASFAGHQGHDGFVHFDDLTPAEQALWRAVALAVADELAYIQSELQDRRRRRRAGKTPVEKKPKKKRA